MYAAVNSTSTIASGSRVVTTVHYATGEYLVEFDRDVSTCAYAATPDPDSLPIEAEPVPNGIVGVTDADSVAVVITSLGGADVNSAFTLTVTC